MQLALVQKSFVRSLSWEVDKALLLRNITLVLLGSLLLAVAAKICVPLQPIPVTLQSLAVLFLGMTYGVRLGVLAILAYLAAGWGGLPLFAVPHMGMTTGYLLGFLLAVGFTGFLAERGWARHIFSTIIATLLGSILILLCGWIVLAQFIGAAAAFDAGVRPFLLGDSLKIIFLTCVVPSFWRLASAPR